jgi:tetratricopeptide (TPR) repeat protein
MSGVTDAELLHQRSLSLKMVTAGPNDPGCAITMSEMATMYEKRRDGSSALYLRRAALEMFKGAAGSASYPDLKASLAYALTLYKFGDVANALVEIRRVVELVEARYGSRDSLLAPGYTLLALCMTAADEESRADAEKVAKRAESLAESIAGQESEMFANATQVLGYALERRGEYELAEEAYQKAIETRAAILGPVHSYRPLEVTYLALLYLRHRFYSEAEPIVREG